MNMCCSDFNAPLHHDVSCSSFILGTLRLENDEDAANTKVLNPPTNKFLDSINIAT